MRAVVFDRQLRFDQNYPDPKPGPDEALVRVHVAGISWEDLRIAAGEARFRGVPGHECVGTVVVGPPAWEGKRVACEAPCVCRSCDHCRSGLARHCRQKTVIGWDGRDGGLADFVAVPIANLHPLPTGITDDEAVFVPLLAAARQVLVQCAIEPRHQVSVVGSGRLGLLVAQVVKGTGCKLTVFGRNRATLLLCEKYGIQAMTAEECTARQDRDYVIECSGSPGGLQLALGLVRPRGTIVLKSRYAEAASDLTTLVDHEIQLSGSGDGSFPEAIDALARQAVEVRSLISRVYPAEQAMSAFEAAVKPEFVKVLLKFGPR
jgi:threonine dehydrogenase-like Zn-dependent dehydrogenase